MIHFKKLKRLLLVAGLLSAQALAADPAAAACKFELQPSSSAGTRYTIKKASDSGTCAAGYYLLDPETYAILTTGSGILINVDGSGGVTLKDNPVPGFYKNGSTYIQCKIYGYCEVVTPVSGSCSAANAGKLIKSDTTAVLCLGNFAPPQEGTPTTPSKREVTGTTNTFPTLTFAAETGTVSYLVQHVPATETAENVFSFAKGANFYAVKHDANSIVLDESADHATGAGDKAALYTDGKIIDRENELCNIAASSGRYYSCTKGVCTSTTKTSSEPESNGDSEAIGLVINTTSGCSVATTGTATHTVYDNSGYLLTTDGKLVKYTISGNAGNCEVVQKAGYFRDSVNYKNVIKCDSTYSCKDIADTTDTAVVSTDCNDSNKGKILTTDYNAVVCIDGSTGTVQRFSGTEDHAYGPSSAFGTATGYYKVKVSEDTIELDIDEAGDKSYFIQDKLTDIKIYECDPTNNAECTVLTNTYHYDEGKEVLYHCADNTSKCTPVNDTSDPKVKTGFYPAELIVPSSTPAKYNNLIECTVEEGVDESGNPTITSFSCGNYDDLIPGYYIDATQATGTPSIIQCTQGETTDPITCVIQTTVTPGQAYLNEGNKDGNTYKEVIVCKESDACSIMDNPAGDSKYYYIDATYTVPSPGNGKTQIITCTSSSCTSSGEITPEPGVAYIDAAVVVKTTTTDTPPVDVIKFTNLIKLDATNVWATEAITETAGVAYIDGGVSPHKNVIICTTAGGCVSEPGKSDVPGYVYINGINDDSTSDQNLRKRQEPAEGQTATLLTSIIRCDESNVCKSEEGSVMDGEAYIDATDKTEGGPVKVIECSDATAGCKSDVGIDATTKIDTYVNAIKTEQVINCITGVGCIIIPSQPRDGRSEYYPTSKDGTESLINCVYANNAKKCEKISTTATAAHRRTDPEVPAAASDTKDYAHNVFINALNGKNEKTDTNPIIICDKDKVCKSKGDSDITFPEGVEKLYYRNQFHLY